ncbi:MAG: UDP-N-acetylglucosamine--N-acetylmuramyl-(pentapeptide) pyrophosphoryl-undecaprenol N-acetylglucosamine transferase [Thermosulfidibacteraceae bacterium]
MRWIVTGGGTGGHFFPAFEVMKFLRERGEDVLYLGVKRGIEASIIPKSGIPYRLFDFEGVRGRGVRSIFALLKLIPSVIEVAKVFAHFKPDLVFMTGGYVSVPVFIVAFIKDIPIFIHEQNSIPGSSNILTSKFAKGVFVTFEESLKHFKNDRLFVSGNVIREEFFKETYPLRSYIRLLVIGGSLGARSINKAVVGMLQLLKRLNIEILHQTGRLDYDGIVESYKDLGYSNAKVFPFYDRPWELLKEATLIVSRAGSSAISEIVLAGRCAIIVPYPYAAGNHQLVNAKILQRLAPIRILEDHELGMLFREIFLYYINRRRLVKCCSKIKRAIIIGKARDIVIKMLGEK